MGLPTHTLRMLMYVGDNSIYWKKLVTMCHGSNAKRLLKRYTAYVSVWCRKGLEGK